MQERPHAKCLAHSIGKTLRQIMARAAAGNLVIGEGSEVGHLRWHLIVEHNCGLFGINAPLPSDASINRPTFFFNHHDDSANPFKIFFLNAVSIEIDGNCSNASKCSALLIYINASQTAGSHHD